MASCLEPLLQFKNTALCLFVGGLMRINHLLIGGWGGIMSHINVTFKIQQLEALK